MNAKHRSWLGFYTPHWAPIKFKGEWVNFPRYTDDCYNKPESGMNKKMAYDCGKPRGWIKKVGWKAGNDKWPCAYQAVRNFKIDNQSMGEMIGKVDLEGNKVDGVVDNWIKTNKSTLEQVGLSVVDPIYLGRRAWDRPASQPIHALKTDGVDRRILTAGSYRYWFDNVGIKDTPAKAYGRCSVTMPRTFWLHTISLPPTNNLPTPG